MTEEKSTLRDHATKGGGLGTYELHWYTQELCFAAVEVKLLERDATLELSAKRLSVGARSR